MGEYFYLRKTEEVIPDSAISSVGVFNLLVILSPEMVLPSVFQKELFFFFEET